MSLIIRPAQRGDAPLVLAFVQELAEYERLAHEVDATESLIDQALFGASLNTFCEIAEWNGAPAGFALWFLNFSSFRGRNGLWLEDLYVRSSHRGLGIGAALLCRLAGRCVDEGWTRLEWSVLDWNEPSIEFYKAKGAKFMSEWTTCRVTGDALQTLAERDKRAS
jgi:GNAT superfamily N-acetyltransferase